jgi:glycogen synthase
VKVLMLSWEYPPHVTGGLATACAGMCEGLSRIGVEPTIVVPRAHGDEDQSFGPVIGCNTLPAALELALEPRDGAGAEDAERADRARSASTATSTAGVPERLRPSVVRRTLEELALSPYATIREYGEWFERVSRFAPAPPAVPAADELRETLVSARPSADAVVDAVERRRLAGPGSPGTPLSFTGAYGPDLFGEVSRYAIRVAEIVARESFDVIHAHDWMTFPAGIAASRVSGRPWIAHVHASEYDRSGEAPDTRIRSLEQLGLATAARVVCVSHYTAGVLQKHYAVDETKLRVVHNAVTRAEQVERLRSGRRIADPIVLFLGRVTFQKGPDYFLEAARRVVEIESRVKFVMVGAGDMLPSMVERAARLGLARHIHFTGFLRAQDVERIYSMADIYVMPSVSEPFGISPLEALALDVPVIVSRQSGVSEVLRNALKVDFWDTTEIANKILALLRFPALREYLLASGRDELRAMSWEDRARKLRDVYGELVR